MSLIRMKPLMRAIRPFQRQQPQQQQQRYRLISYRNFSTETTATQGKPQPQPQPQPQQPSKAKTFMKKYGYVGIGVYTVLSVIDLSATMGIISLKGADSALRAEHYVLTKVKSWFGMEHEPLDQSRLNQKPSFTSIFVIAYGIHKTVMLPVRLSLTAAITPMVAKRLKALGWIQRTTKK